MEKKRQESWFRWQFLCLKGEDNGPKEGAFETAVAAAALAIQSVEQSKTTNKKTRTGLPISNAVIRQFSYKKTNNSGETSNRKSMEQDKEGQRVSWTSKLNPKSSFKLTKSVDSSKKKDGSTT